MSPSADPPVDQNFNVEHNIVTYFQSAASFWQDMDTYTNPFPFESFMSFFGSMISSILGKEKWREVSEYSTTAWERTTTVVDLYPALAEKLMGHMMRMIREVDSPSTTQRRTLSEFKAIVRAAGQRKPDMDPSFNYWVNLILDVSRKNIRRMTEKEVENA